MEPRRKPLGLPQTAYDYRDLPEVRPCFITAQLVPIVIQATLHIQLCLPAGTWRGVFASGTYGTSNNPRLRLVPVRPPSAQVFLHIEQVKCFHTKISNVIWQDSHILASSVNNHIAAIPYTYTNSVIQPT